MVLTYPLTSRSAVMAASTAARSAPWGKLVAMTVSMAAMVSGPDLRMASVASTDLALKEEMVDMAAAGRSDGTTRIVANKKKWPRIRITE